MKKFNYILMILLVVSIIASCAPIDGLGGEEDNLPDIQGSKEEEIAPIAPVNDPEIIEVIPEEEISVIPELEEAQVNYVRIKADALNVRSDASLEAERLTKIYDGQIYEVLAEKKDLAGHVWYQVESADSIIGWISSDYCVGGTSYNELILEE